MSYNSDFDWGTGLMITAILFMLNLDECTAREHGGHVYKDDLNKIMLKLDDLSNKK